VVASNGNAAAEGSFIEIALVMLGQYIPAMEVLYDQWMAQQWIFFPLGN
jgi:hypothetical protein